jgi:5-methylcytosine-specific restriction endonuclease McrA
MNENSKVRLWMTELLGWILVLQLIGILILSFLLREWVFFVAAEILLPLCIVAAAAQYSEWERPSHHANYQPDHTPIVIPKGATIRRARMRQNGGKHTAAEWRQVCEDAGWRCLCCDSDGPLTKDHVIPVKFGGSDDISNIQPLCKSCNSRKNAEWIDYRQRHIDSCPMKP